MPNAFDTVIEFARGMSSSVRPSPTDTRSSMVKFLTQAKPAPFSGPMTVAPTHQNNPPAGLVQYGNIDLQSRPNVYNPDGSVSSVRSSSFTDQHGREVLVPTVSDGGAS